MLRAFLATIVALTGVVLAGAPAVAQSTYRYPEKTALSAYDEAVFFFAGRFHTDWFKDSLTPWSVNWDGSYILGGGYQKTLVDWKDFRLGLEGGIAGRFAPDGASAEVWGGVYGRYDGWVFGNFRFSPALTFGLSVTTGTQGYEGARMNQWGSYEPLLVYLGPEFIFSLADQPQWEVFTRFQHRSGAYGLIADLDASNAVTAGFRYKF
jgi:hypothetical protein